GGRARGRPGRHGRTSAPRPDQASPPSASGCADATLSRSESLGRDQAVVTASGRGPRGLIVDWGGVLTSPLARSMLAWADADDIDLAEFREAMAQWLGPPAAEEVQWNPVAALERGEVAVPDFEQQLAARLRTRSGRAVPPDGLITRMFTQFEHAADMANVVRKVHRAGFRTALLSNSWGNDYPRDGWDDLFDAVVIS